jgi:hypothetical protein
VRNSLGQQRRMRRTLLCCLSAGDAFSGVGWNLNLTNLDAHRTSLFILAGELGTHRIVGNARCGWSMDRYVSSVRPSQAQPALCRRNSSDVGIRFCHIGEILPPMANDPHQPVDAFARVADVADDPFPCEVLTAFCL